MITIKAIHWIKPVITPDMREWAVRAVNVGRSRLWVAREIGVERDTIDKWMRSAARFGPSIEHGSVSGAPEPRRQPVARREGRQ